ncbi:MAG: hypothetical protein D4S01_09090 [Dehalococcoidia bacterium]|nr:MAG: hypothetical protein D4S01_09090 [Dehalococcoidia bacterium]
MLEQKEVIHGIGAQIAVFILHLSQKLPTLDLVMTSVINAKLRKKTENVEHNRTKNNRKISKKHTRNYSS